MKKYSFFWLTGKKEVLPGRNPADALNSAGYSIGALRALDFHASGDNNEYEWSAKLHKWVKRQEAKA